MTDPVELPDPLTPPDCDLRDFPFMPLHVQRLRDSDLVAEFSLEEVGANSLLWCTSWHQVPAASLPNNDKSLMRFIGLGKDTAHFRRIRAGALHGWMLCNDNRLYHPLVAREANIAWERKRHQRWMTECARIKKHNQRHKTDHPFPTYDEFEAAGFIPAKLPVPPLSPGTPTGHAIHRDRDSDRDSDSDSDSDSDTVEEGYPSQSSAQVIGIGGTRA